MIRTTRRPDGGAPPARRHWSRLSVAHASELRSSPAPAPGFDSQASRRSIPCLFEPPASWSKTRHCPLPGRAHDARGGEPRSAIPPAEILTREHATASPPGPGGRPGRALGKTCGPPWPTGRGETSEREVGLLRRQRSRFSTTNDEARTRTTPTTGQCDVPGRTAAAHWTTARWRGTPSGSDSPRATHGPMTQGRRLHAPRDPGGRREIAWIAPPPNRLGRSPSGRWRVG